MASSAAVAVLNYNAQHAVSNGKRPIILCQSASAAVSGFSYKKKADFRNKL